MKKIILVFALLFSLLAGAQNFPGEKVELLSGKTLKVSPVKESLQKYGYNGFYKDINLKKVYKKEGENTPYAELADKEFKVVSYEAYTDLLHNKKFKLVIENPETGQLYFNYDPRYSGSFPFEVIGGLDIDYTDNLYCKYVLKQEAGKKYYSTESIEGIAFFKDLRVSPPEYGVMLYVPNNVGTGDVVIEFSDGKKIERSNVELKEIDNGVGGKAYMATIVLPRGQSTDFVYSDITKIKISTVERKIKDVMAVRGAFYCLMSRYLQK